MTSDPARSTSGEAGNPRVLIVDDNRDLALSLARLLQLMGYEVHTVFDGHDGLRAARAIAPHAILLDIGLPNMDGYQVARALREEGFDETMIIAVSGYGQEEDRQRSRQAGMDHHVTKPVDVKTIASLIGKPE
ncbi:response regulator [Aquisphaera insulae]|uniref:response regulator n=1 Tax=Aquisphaera insulae TaxID=2712864 RepID=UPI0013EDDBF0|nr:response regulator [Aquisphaera insulae]